MRNQNDPVECTECGKVHEFPVPKFKHGDKVRITNSPNGYHYRDKIGKIVTIDEPLRFLAMPCDTVEYRLVEYPSQGAILESRLEIVAESK